MEQRTDTLRIVKKAVIELDADAGTVFPLLCPVKEVDWIDGWENICTLIYTDSGIAEEACVFETETPEEGKALWICSHYDAPGTQIEYIKHIIDKAIIKWCMTVRTVSAGKSVIDMIFIITSLSDEGKAFVKHFDEFGLNILLNGLEDKINYYVTQGCMKKN